MNIMPRLTPASTLLFCQLLSCWLLTTPLPAAETADNSAAKLKFARHVLPILKAKCLSCHSGERPKASLDLTTVGGVMRGGQSGAVLRRASAESSLLWERIAAGEMPPKGTPLTAEEKGVLRTWINEGDPADFAGVAVDSGDLNISAEAKDFWSFQPPKRAELPRVKSADLIRNPIDVFILARLEGAKLTLSREAPREALIRRASFDLLGLPPTPEAVREFVADERFDAYERLIDRLLASPAYGERWGRHWLDVAGYSDSAGILNEDRPLPLAFRYRDYIVQAFNKDKPYDRFLQEQIAGDELVNYWHHYENDEALSEEIIEAITATGYLRCAPDPSRPDFTTIKNADSQYFYPTINDTMQIVATSTMGLTLQCARCHNHMYDPIPQQDFYRVQAIFMGAYRPTKWIPQMERRLTTLSKSQLEHAKKTNAEVDANTKKLEAEIAKLRETYKKKAESKESDATKLDEALSAKYPDYKQSFAQLRERIAVERRRWYYYDEIRALFDLPGEVPTPFLRRGDALTPAHHVSPGGLSVLKDAVDLSWNKPAEETRSSGRRLAFAKWLTDPKHPLTARVMVNRVWLHHFGEGIVSTPDDFGNAGELPSHPDLLDWLAIEFMERGWSIKQLHRLIMTSSTYRQSSRGNPATDLANNTDPDNRLLWRQRMRRLEAEAVRDAVLHVSGSLSTRMFGPSIPTTRASTGEVTIAGDTRRRSVYIQTLRLQPLTMLNVFDQPVMETNCTERSESTVSTQALTLLNSQEMISAADAFAQRILSSDEAGPETQAVWLAFGRAPSASELQVLTEFLQSQQQRYAEASEANAAAAEIKRRAVADLCHMLLSANEFVYLD